MADTRYLVHYKHIASYQAYWVSRSFSTREGAQEFIDVNALVWPLPGPAWIEELSS
jgi:hypothetical protein